MKKIYLTILLFCCLVGANAQNPAFHWAKHIVGDSFTDNRGYAIAADTFGNIYTTGYFMDTIDFDPGSGTAILASHGSIDIYVTKMDKGGNLVWARSIGGVGEDGGLGIVLDNSGNIYISGGFSDTVDFNPDSGVYNLVSEGYLDACVIKLNSSGQLVWAKALGGLYDELGYAIARDNSGNIYSTGYFQDVVDFDPGTGSNTLSAEGYYDVFISKLDASGNYVWAKQFAGKNGSNVNVPFGIAADAGGNVYITGRFEDTVDFNPGSGTVNLVAYGYEDIFVAKLNGLGNYVWAKQVGSTETDYGSSLTVDGSNNVYITGMFSDQADFNPGAGTFNMSPSGGSDIFILKLDGNGNYAWAKRIGGADEDEGYSIIADAANNIYVSSSFYGTVDYDPNSGTKNLSSFGYGDLAILKLSPSGQFQWVQQFGGTDAYVSNTALAWSKTGAVYATGSFTGEVDFDPGTDTLLLSAVDKYDIFSLKLQECITTSETITASACKSYTLNSQTYSTSGTYTQKITNSGGCDSMITLKLTIKNTANTINASACKDYTINGQTYTTSGVYTQTLTNAAGCDSVLTINLKIQNTADTITASACNSYTLNSQTYTTTGVYLQTLTNAAGCDSFLTLFLTIGSQNSSSTITETACDSYTLNGQTYTTSGTYNQTIKNVSGCDSFITLNLTVKKTTRKTMPVTSCKSYTLNGQTYTSSGGYIQVLVNAAGCDSVLTINLTIINVVKTVSLSGFTITADATGATYQWVDCGNAMAPISGATQQSYSPVVNGSYAVFVTQNSCTDTSTCVVISGLGISTALPAVGIKVFPNPTQGDITVLLHKEISKGSMRLLSLDGKVVLEKPGVQGTSLHVDISAVSKGIYILEIQDSGVIYRAQVVKD